jgi:hypothetical protein
MNELYSRLNSNPHFRPKVQNNVCVSNPWSDVTKLFIVHLAKKRLKLQALANKIPTI